MTLFYTYVCGGCGLTQGASEPVKTFHEAVEEAVKAGCTTSPEYGWLCKVCVLRGPM